MRDDMETLMRFFFGIKKTEKRPKKMSGLWFLVILCFIFHPSSLIPSAYAAFEDTGLSARLRGMGDSATALDDANGALLNPAIPGSTRKLETGAHFEAGTRSSLGPLDFDSYAAGAAIPRMAYGKLGTMSILGRYRALGADLKEKMFSLGWATWQFRKAGAGALDLGAGLKFMQLSSVRSGDSKMALGLDLGALWRADTKHNFGLSLLNVNSPSFREGALKDKAPFSARLGVAEKTEDYTLTLDVANRSGAGGYKGNFSVNSGFEYLWRTYRYGIFSSRAGLSLAPNASFVSLGAGYRRPASEISYSLLVPLTGTITPGHVLSLSIRFGDKDSGSEYEKLVRQEIKYRKDLMEALDESARRESILRDELSDLKNETALLNAGLKAAREQKAEVTQAREKLEAIVERQRRAEAELRSLEEKRNNDKLNQLRFDFSGDWAAYLKMRSGGAPKESLKGVLQRIVGRYQGAGIDISQATVELQGLLQQQ
ncbi:MAG: hypothetical protein A2X28_04370 [Elusimicrobia bacterium GWA2_56_46]|nr:MAG: hypothetical protein A2X28_04370 [Elusimicrobia bacterium GWA2_56_46]OGR56111.1 MAG: hypothetical protein A2X39_07790 [Elusimicrobia bacterium GWC2_56_31]HBB66145.1 hypothetical protein [Elusimicrobiota bacterium]HBW22947.1 hypothetical protein [Elusimicrobiota bacterium]